MIFPLTDTNGNVACKDANSSANSGAPVLILAGGTGDGVKITGVTLDRQSGTGMATSAVFATGYLAALTNAKTLSFAVEYQDSADGSTWNTAVALQASTVAVTATSSTNFRGIVENALNMAGLERYVRVNVTPDLSATGTDTCTFHTVGVFGGYTQNAV